MDNYIEYGVLTQDHTNLDTIEIKQCVASRFNLWISTKIDSCCTGWLRFKGDLGTGICFAPHIVFRGGCQCRNGWIFKSSKNLCCTFWTFKQDFCAWICKKKRKMIIQNWGWGGQRPFETFPKVHPYWYQHPSLGWPYKGRHQLKKKRFLSGIAWIT